MPVIRKLYDSVDEHTQLFGGFVIFEYGIATDIEDAYKGVVNFIKNNK